MERNDAAECSLAILELPKKEAGFIDSSNDDVLRIADDAKSLD
jgi:hypothetical protein